MQDLDNLHIGEDVIILPHMQPKPHSWDTDIHNLTCIRKM